MENQLLSVKETAALLKVSYITILRLIARNELTSYAIGTVYRIKRDDIEKFLMRKRKQ